MNSVRERKYLEAKSLDSFYTYSNDSICHASDIGEYFYFGGQCNQPFVKIGNNCILWSGNHVGHHSTIADHCFITSHVVISGSSSIGRNSFLGVNSTIGDNVIIGESNLVGAGSELTVNTEPNSVYSSCKPRLHSFTSDRVNF